MKREIVYEFHHMGIPTIEVKPDETYSPLAKMYTSDNEGTFKIQWHRFESDSLLHPLLRMLPHVAFKVNDREPNPVKLPELGFFLCPLPTYDLAQRTFIQFLL